MKILLVCNSQIPISTYEDAERVMWWLGKELTKRGHHVTFLAKKGSTCPFATVIALPERKWCTFIRRPEKSPQFLT